MSKKTKEDVQKNPIKNSKPFIDKDIKKDSHKTDLNSNTVKKSAIKKSIKKQAKPDLSVKEMPKSNIKSKKEKLTPIYNIEYYDLPLRYNQTIVKILAQTPNMLFVYWDIADTDRKSFIEHYGNNFFKETKPVLIVHNETMNYSFEVEINDFANSWYLHVNDANCKYSIELGRRPLAHVSTVKEEYIYVSSSNEIDSPNNHILFERFNPSVTYKNLKNGNITKRDFSSISKYKNMQEIYNIYDLYKTIYKDELFGEIINENLINPSSMSSSSFK